MHYQLINYSFFTFQAIETDPNNAVYYANRSIAYLRTECFGYALADASKAIETDKTYLKERCIPVVLISVSDPYSIESGTS